MSIKLTEAADLYERHLRARGLAPNTVKGNTQTVNRAVAVWGNILVSSVTPAHIDRMFEHYGWAPSTRNLYLSQLRRFFQWCRRHKYMPKDADPTDGWDAIRVPKVPRTRIPLEEFGELLDASPHPRDRAVCAIGLYAFLRGSEIQTLTIGDVNLDDNELTVFRHKTKDADVLPISLELAEEMVRWLNWYRADQGRLQSNWYLLPAKVANRTGYDPETRRIYVDLSRPAPLKPTVMQGHPYRPAQRALAAMGYETHREGEHTLRRSGARALADSLRDRGHDAALMRVASMLGHSDVRVTQMYIGWQMEREQRNADIAGKPLFGGRERHIVAATLKGA